MSETIECRRCKRYRPVKATVCLVCYDQLDDQITADASALEKVADRAIANWWSCYQHRETETSAIIKRVWWRIAALIVLWQVLSHVGGLIEGVWHWKLVTLLGA